MPRLRFKNLVFDRAYSAPHCSEASERPFISAITAQFLDIQAGQAGQTCPTFSRQRSFSAQ
jgi:hypothetical protein